MERELKIVMKCNEGEPLTNHKTIVYINNQAVGCIQDIKISVSAEHMLPKIEITFPNLRSSSISKDYINRTYGLVKCVDYYISELSKFPNVNIMKEILGGIDDEHLVNELGTDGHIDNFKVELE